MPQSAKQGTPEEKSNNGEQPNLETARVAWLIQREKRKQRREKRYQQKAEIAGEKRQFQAFIEVAARAVDVELPANCWRNPSTAQ